MWWIKKPLAPLTNTRLNKERNQDVRICKCIKNSKIHGSFFAQGLDDLAGLCFVKKDQENPSPDLSNSLKTYQRPFDIMIIFSSLHSYKECSKRMVLVLDVNHVHILDTVTVALGIPARAQGRFRVGCRRHDRTWWQGFFCKAWHPTHIHRQTGLQVLLPMDMQNKL